MSELFSKSVFDINYVLTDAVLMAAEQIVNSEFYSTKIQDLTFCIAATKKARNALYINASSDGKVYTRLFL